MKILFINHSLEKTGAPMVLYYFLEWIKNNQPDVHTTLFSLQGGSLREMFSKEVNTHIVNSYTQNVFSKATRFLKRKVGIDELNENFVYQSKIQKVAQQNTFDVIYLNTVVGLKTALTFKKLFPQAKLIVHVHELADSIKTYTQGIELNEIPIDHFIAVSALVKSTLVNNFNVLESKISVVYEFTKVQEVEEITKYVHKDKLVIGGAGFASNRKGIDLFIQVAAHLKDQIQLPFEMHWLGKMDEETEQKYRQYARELGVASFVKFLGFTNNVDTFYRSLDFFLMTSREDPFPLVCIEAANYQLPVFCFQGATGTEEILDGFSELIIPDFNTQKMAQHLITLSNNEMRYCEIGKALKSRFSVFNPSTQAKFLWRNLIK